MTLAANAEQLLEYSVLLIKDGQPDIARKFLEKAIEREPSNVNALLLLAGVCDRGEDSLRYLARVLAIDPKIERAHAGIRWARRRVHPSLAEGGDQETRPLSALPFDQGPSVVTEPDRAAQPESKNGQGTHPAAGLLLGGLIGLILIACLGVGAIWLFGPPRNANAQIAPAIAATATATLAPISTATSIPTATAIPTATSTPTLAPTEIVAQATAIGPTEVPTEVPTAAPLPTDPPTIEPTAAPIDPPPPTTDQTRWIDVDLTNQVLRAYEGNTVVRTTLVSSGLPGSPTVTGQFNIYVKYPAQLMVGPGYYLPDVPWVMYFYEGYGLHGTYWHHNFGHPMSHGCVNLPTPEAEWLYNWASVGTLVNIHY